MSKIKVLIYLSVILLIFNVVLVGFIITHGPQRAGRGEGPRQYIIEKLHFDKGQIEAYGKMIREHRRLINEKEQKIMELKQQLYNLLQSGRSKVDADTLINAIAAVQAEIEQVNFNHFQDIKSLCRPDQQRDFDRLCLEIAGLFNHRRPPHER